MGRIHSDALRFYAFTAVLSYFRQRSLDNVFDCFFLLSCFSNHYDYHTTGKIVRVEKGTKRMECRYHTTSRDFLGLHDHNCDTHPPLNKHTLTRRVQETPPITS